MATRLLIPYLPATDPLEGPLQELVRAHAAERSAVLVLPGRNQRSRARQTLARRLGGCDPRLATGFGGLARRILGTRAPRVASERERDAYLAQALSELPGQAQHLTLRYRGFRKGLLHVFRELESNGLSEQELEGHLEGARLDPQRAGRLHSAYRGYRARLQAGPRDPGAPGPGQAPALVTEADLLHRAAEALRDPAESHPNLPRLVIVAGFCDLSPRQLSFVDALASVEGIEAVQIHWPSLSAPNPGLAWPAQTAALLEESYGFERPPEPPPPGPERPAVLERLEAELFAPSSPVLGAEAWGPGPAPLRIVRAASREDEVELALTQVRAFVLERAAGSWRDVLIVASDPERYRSLLRRVAQELGVPLRVEGRRPLTSAASVRGALALLEAAARFDLGPLLVAAASPALGLSVEEADRLARAARRIFCTSGWSACWRVSWAAPPGPSSSRRPSWAWPSRSPARRSWSGSSAPPTRPAATSPKAAPRPAAPRARSERSSGDSCARPV